MRGGPSCTGGRVQLPHSNKLTSPLAHMFIAVVTAMVRRAVTPRTQRKKMPMRKSTRRGEKPPGKKEKCRQELRWQGSKQCLFSNQYLWMWFLLLEFFLTFSQTFLCFDRYWPRCTLRIHNLMESSTFYNDKLLRDLSRPIKFQLITVHLNNGSWFHETTKS